MQDDELIHRNVKNPETVSQFTSHDPDEDEKVNPKRATGVK